MGAAGQQPAPPAAAPAQAGQEAAAADGATLFGMPPAGKGCAVCHSLDATSKAKMIGPNLANIGSRRYIGAGMLLNTDENLARWIFNPQLIKHGIIMQPMGLTMDQARTVAAYLRTQR